MVDFFPVPGNARPSTITGLANWPSRAVVKPGGESTVAVSSSGKSVTIDGGGAPNGTIFGIRDAAAGELPEGLTPDATFVLDVVAGAIDPAIAATVNLGVPANAGELFVLGRTAVVPGQGRIESQAVAFGLGLGDGDMSDRKGACIPERCLQCDRCRGSLASSRIWRRASGGAR